MTSKEVLEYLRTCKYCKIVMGTDYENDDRYFTLYDVFSEEIEIIQKDLNRLEEYRKIEEELDIDLITLFKALKDGIYINEDGSVYKDCIKSIEHWSDGWGFISNDDYIEALFKDYGISWALTEEEFYKNIK